jgi:HAMP domain-containing protein
MKILGNLKLLAKLAIPAAVLIAVSAGMILLARSSLSNLDSNTQHIVDYSARRAVLALQLAVAVDEATIREKNLIIERGGPDGQGLRDQHADAGRAANKATDELIQLSDTPARRAVNEQLKQLSSRFFSTSRAVVDAVMEGDVASATRLSNGDGRAARKALVEAVNERVTANVEALGEEKRRAGEVAAAATQTLTVVAGAGLLAAFGLLGAIVIIGVTRPLNSLVGVLQSMAKGQVDAQIPEAVRGDEIGEVGRAVEGIRDMVARKAAEEAESSVAAMRRPRPSGGGRWSSWRTDSNARSAASSARCRRRPPSCRRPPAP